MERPRTADHIEVTRKGRDVRIREPGGPLRSILLAIGVLFLLTLVMPGIVFLVAPDTPRWFRTFGAGMFFLFSLIPAFHGVSMVLRSWDLRREDGTLTVESSGLLGTRVHRRPWDRVRISVPRVGTRSSELGPDHPIHELRIDCEGFRRIRVLRSTNTDLLFWIAAELRRRPAPDAAELRPARGVCLICGTGMAQRIVICSRCRTPHHEDCWQYTGQCSTFGCREIRFVRA